MVVFSKLSTEAFLSRTVLYLRRSSRGSGPRHHWSLRRPSRGSRDARAKGGGNEAKANEVGLQIVGPRGPPDRAFSFRMSLESG